MSDYSQEKIDHWAISSSISYFSGDYGTDITTNTVYIPVTLTRFFSRAELSVSLPYIYQESGEGVTAFGGFPLRTDDDDTGETRTAEGFGDVVLSGRFYSLYEDVHPINLSLMGEIKFPTADEEDGLTTGEFDETIGIEMSKSLSERWQAIVDLYYTFIGDPENFEIDDEFNYNLGLSYGFTPYTALTVIYQERTALVDDEDNPRQIVTYVSHQIKESIGLIGGVLFGLTDGSPDVGITGGFNWRF